MTKSKLFTNLRGDILGGITAGVVALPLALAFGVTSGLGAPAGLYGAIAVGIMAAIFGGTPSQISGPTGPMTVVSATIIAAHPDKPELVFGTFLVAGIIQIILGVAKLGRLVRFIPYPVVSGFMSGIGVIIILLQLFPFVGLPASPKVLDSLTNIEKIIFSGNWQATLCATITLVLVYLTPKLIKSLPGTLAGLFGGTILAELLVFDIPRIGEIPDKLPALNIPISVFSSLPSVLIPALTLAALGAIDSLLTSVVADTLTKTTHNSNRELIGQGIGNAVASFFGGIPGAGATMRTVVNINSGGRYQLSGVIHGFLLLAILCGLGPYAERIPLAVLAGILLTVGISIIDYRGIRHALFVPRSDAVIMLVVLLFTVFFDLLQAVALGLLLAAVLFIRTINDLIEQSAAFGELSGKQQNPQDQPYSVPESLHNKGIYIKRMQGPLFFGFAARFRELVAANPTAKAVIFDFSKVNYIDQSGLYALESAIKELQAAGISVLLVSIGRKCFRMLYTTKIIPSTLSRHQIFRSMPRALAYLERLAVSSKQ